MKTKVSKALTQPVAGLALLAMVATTYPSPSWAQVPAPATTVQENVEYTLGGGDRIRINVFEVPEYSGDYQIPPGGDLYLPLIGRVVIRGLTQNQAAELITTRYARFLRRPIVTVSLIAPRPINVIVSGEVVSPGSYTVGLQGGAGDNPGVQYPTIISALNLAEGVTLAADLRQVQLRRPQGGNLPVKVYSVDLTQLVRTGTVDHDLTLRDGDAIFIPTATSINLAELRQFASASFAVPANRPRTVTVVGEVNRPGSYVVTGGGVSTAAATDQGGNQGGANNNGLPTVTRAIQLAGGITSDADIRSILIRRPTKSGTEHSINVNLWDLLKTGDVNQDTLVQEGDTIVIGTATDVNPAEATELADANFSPATIPVSVVGEVKTPGVLNLPPNTPMNQAILSAGGFNNARARRNTVELVRLNPDGTVTRRNIETNFEQGINEQTNPRLRANDIVVVNRSGIARIGDTLGTALGPLGGVINILRFIGF
ncbi:SLBB domain-containing protein [Gloeocapsopsis crepidinum LEGE 06123]|uniref:SLBB domain-containing protein n=1 Tax=Gloeocapsopsis crepidinum LEGE 06123 TaxID=588587 RepID=A0ABR9UN75_9CHRO|nr:SLBB domain-containing protein [Gloeocapsopsis crepidinum]MBE9189747.1 SLBB domain-containing protein [Gloeocapsopsis crepidinum LEGE 06123]